MEIKSHDSVVSGAVTNNDVPFSVTKHRNIVGYLYSKTSCAVCEMLVSMHSISIRKSSLKVKVFF